MSNDLQDNVVFVSGANRGIGKVIVENAVQRGAKKVYAAVRKLDSAQALVEQLGDAIVPVHFDLENPQSILDAAATADDVDIVINNAGVLRNSNPLAGDAIESLEFEVNANVSGLIRVAQAFAPVLKANGGGALVQLNSVASIKAFPDFSTYSASKAASYSITQSLRDVLAEQGTHVVSVHPGPIATDMANDAGLTEIAEPPSLVADSIFNAIENEEFHAFPDSMAKQIGGAYESYAKSIVEVSMSEG